MACSSKIEIEKFNGKIFALWKLKMEDILVDNDKWIIVVSDIALTRMFIEFGESLIRMKR